MFHVIDWERRADFTEAVEQMHRLRKEVFIDYYKWDLAHEDGLEIDQFDTPEAYYLFDLDPDTGTMLSSLRMLPTLGHHMMDPLFRHLCAADYPRGAHVFEVSRLLYNPALMSAGEARILRARRRLILGMLEFCQQRGIHELVFVTHAKFLARLMSYDWDIRPLGLPAQDGNQQVAAVRLTLTPDTLSRIRAQFKYPEPVMTTWPTLAPKAA